MKSFRKELWFNTKTRRELINITPQVESALAESGIKEGLCLVNAMHITASVFINDDEPGLHQVVQPDFRLGDEEFPQGDDPQEGFAFSQDIEIVDGLGLRRQFP